MKDQSVWYKINKDSPLEYAATVTVNPLTALRMLEDFTTLKSGTATSVISLNFFFLSFFQVTNWVPTGDAVVQNGATSIVGQCIIQLAKNRGIHSVNIIRDRC